MSLAITENWIRDRIQLNDENLEDIKSLSLPGTYHEKITQLGNALYHFSRLKELDLSRNALENLDGLQHLKLLESLNLYYNNVTTLNEVHKLRHNTSLQELDLRLNPVARNEPDYRLFVIHMLPNLRRLDDRGVRDQERKAALMHFASDQAAEFRPPSRNFYHDPMMINERPPHVPRADFVSKISTVPPIDTDDASYIDHAQRLDGSRSPSKNRSANVYDRRELLVVERRNARHVSDGSGDALNSSRNAGFAGVVDQFYSQLKPPKGTSQFTANPNSSPGRTWVAHSPPPTLGSDARSQSRESLGPRATPPPPSHGGDQHRQAVISRLCDLVDRYWNGSRSLHSHPKFLSNAMTILADSSAPDGDPIHSRLTTEMEREMDDLKMRLRHLDAENIKLREEKSAFSSPAPSRARESNADLERDNERLRSEVNALRSRLRNFEQSSDLAGMLKESHKALVETNDQLMRELTDLRSKTRADEPLHVNGNAAMARAK